MKVLFVLSLIFAVVFSQTISNLDPFDGVSSKLEVAGTSSETFSESIQQSNIIGGERDIIIVGTGTGSSSNCESETFVENGSWFANNGQTCSADAILQYDGVDGSANRANGLNVDLNSFGAAFLVDIQTDLPTSFSIELFSSGGSSIITQNIQASSTLITHVFPYGQFSGSADFDNIGAIELKIIATINTDVIVTLFDIISNEISGRVFSDCNCNGVQDTEDFGVSGITVTGTPGSGCAAGTSTQTASTQSDGTYLLSGLAACTYTVSISSANSVCNNANSVSADATNDPTNVNFSLEQAGSFDVPADTSISCTQLVNGSPPTSITGEASGSGCGGGSTSVNFEDSEISRVCGGSFVVSRRWFTGGEEGFQTITVTDSGNGPSLSIPSDQTVQCGGDTSTASTGTATATDDCSSNPSVDFVDSSNTQCNADLCVATSTISRTWTAVDDCGNQANSQVQTITVQGCGGGEVPVCPTPTNDDDGDCYVPSYDDDLCICPVGDDDDDDFGSCQYSSSGATSLVVSFALFAIMFFLF